MKHTILNSESSTPVLSRILNLQSGSTAKWGSMTVNEMMFHCAKINGEILKGKENKNKPTAKQVLLRTLVLKVMKQLPKGIKTNPKYLRPKEDNTEFQIQRNHLVESVKKVADHTEAIYGNHPFFGPMDTRKWRRFVFMHLDHHLRQFGV